MTISKIFFAILVGLMLYGCNSEEPQVDLYTKYYTPAMTDKQVKALKSLQKYPKEVQRISTDLSNSNERLFFEINVVYGCTYIGESHFNGTDMYEVGSGKYGNEFTDDFKHPERLARKLGANYYLVSRTHTNGFTKTTTDADAKVAVQGGFGRGMRDSTTITTSGGGITTRRAIFYLCP